MAASLDRGRRLSGYVIATWRAGDAGWIYYTVIDVSFVSSPKIG